MRFPILDSRMYGGMKQRIAFVIIGVFQIRCQHTVWNIYQLLAGLSMHSLVNPLHYGNWTHCHYGSNSHLLCVCDTDVKNIFVHCDGVHIVRLSLKEFLLLAGPSYSPADRSDRLARWSDHR